MSRKPLSIASLALLTCSTPLAQSVHQSLIAPPEPGSNGERFGAAVCALSDIDGDSRTDIAVGVLNAAGSGPSVRIFSGATRSILLSLDLGNVESIDLELAQAGDMTGDGIPELLVGTPRNGALGGRVQVFDLRTGELVRFHDGGTEHQLGASVAGVGDLNGDGRADYAAGAPYAGLNETGAIYLYSGLDGSLLDTQLNPLFEGKIGYGLALLGDVNGDGVDDVGAGGGGTFVIYSPETGQIVRTKEYPDSSYGEEVAAVGDIDDDGYDDYVVTAPRVDFELLSGELIQNVGRIGVYSGFSGALRWAYLGEEGDNVGEDVANVPSSGPDRLLVVSKYKTDLFRGDTGELVESWPTGSGTFYIDRVAARGDINGDLRADILISTECEPDSQGGHVRVYDGASLDEIDEFLPRTGQSFGHAVALLGDIDGDGIPDTAVGSPHDDRPGYDAGTVRARSGATGTQIWQYDGIVGAQAGTALARLSDLNGDGVSELAIGEPRRFSGSIFTSFGRTGVVTVVSGANKEVLFVAEGDEPGEGFGEAIAEIGDRNGDGIPDFAVGAPKLWAPGFFAANVGRVSVRSGLDGSELGTWSGAVGARLGTSLAPLGDVDGDGLADFAAGSPGVQTVDAVRSAVGQSLWTAFHPFAAGLGSSLAALGDVDGDGICDLAAGAPDEVTGGEAVGSVRVLSGATGAALHEIHGLLPDAGFGTSVAGPGDIDADGIPEIAVGTPKRLGTFLSFEGGGVGVYSALGSDPIRTWLGSTAHTRLGSSLASGIDIDADGLVDLATGGPGQNDGLGYAATLITRAFSTEPYGVGTEGCEGEHLLVTDHPPLLGSTIRLRGTGGDRVRSRSSRSRSDRIQAAPIGASARSSTWTCSE